ncbi:MAG: DNA glycosylase [Gemmiger sp.]|uniref:DNA-3-methyladenine glycosylase family protein n=1 Tax=Gemmiger sp. TaxID=2049027 RepID=UPI002E77215B|nr:DNA glycosylase [Gemmiger sp.]MEE0801401.1 DNA glycosylase [Gemmiger sp.]
MIVTIQDDFDLAKIAASGQAFRIARREDTWRFVSGDRVLRIRQLTPDRYETDCTPQDWQTFWHRYFDLDRRYAAVRSAIPKTDAYLRKATQAGQGIRILRQDPWEMLITFIISQRKNIPAICRCVETLCTRFGTPLPAGTGETLCAFPTPQQLDGAAPEAWEGCALGYREAYVRAAARAVAQGTLDLAALDALPDTALVERLMQLYGVGIKVANCVALFGYGRLECAPVDVWIRRVIDRYYDGVNPFPRYGNAGILQQYLFYEARREEHPSR